MSDEAKQGVVQKVLGHVSGAWSFAVGHSVAEVNVGPLEDAVAFAAGAAYINGKDYHDTFLDVVEAIRADAPKIFATHGSVFQVTALAVLDLIAGVVGERHTPSVPTAQQG